MCYWCVLLMCVCLISMPPKKNSPPFHFEKFRSSASGMKKVPARAKSECFFLDWVKKMIVATAICGGKMMKCLMKCWNMTLGFEVFLFVALTTQVEPYIPIDPASLLGFHYQLYSQIWPILAREDAQDVKELAMFKRKVTKLFYRKVFMTCVIIMIHLGSILPFPCLNSIRPQGMMVRMKMMSSPRVFWLEIRQSWRVRPKFIGKRYSLFRT